MTQAIGISGFARSGKTTVANYIEQRYGFQRKHIAEPLRAMLRELMRSNKIPDRTIERYLTGDLKDGYVIPEIGRTSRELQISLGTEWGRELVHPGLWARTWARSVEPGSKVMNDSVRFHNEAREIRRLGGFTILITRKGTEPAAYKWGAFGRFLYRRFGCMWGVHASERTDRLHPTYVIRNDGSLQDLYAQIDAIMEKQNLGLSRAN